MTDKQDIIRMAREAGFRDHHNPDLYDCMVASDKSIERFAALVAEAEREACAKVCDEWSMFQLAFDLAGQIRARGQQ